MTARALGFASGITIPGNIITNQAIGGQIEGYLIQNGL